MKIRPLAAESFHADGQTDRDICSSQISELSCGSILLIYDNYTLNRL